MIVDDRIAIIGSANINERSMRGDRDSELACVIRDTDMIDSTMAGLPFKVCDSHVALTVLLTIRQVGRFAHEMRMRLMREHIGIDVDAMATDAVSILETSATSPKPSENQKPWDPDREQVHGDEDISSSGHHRDRFATGAGSVAEGAKELFGGLEAAGAAASAQTGITAAGHVKHRQRETKTSTSGVPRADREDMESGLSAGPTLEEKAAEQGPGGKPDDAELDPEESPEEQRADGAQPTYRTEDQLRHMVGKQQESSVVPEGSSPQPPSSSFRKRAAGKVPGLKLAFADADEAEDAEPYSASARTRDRALSLTSNGSDIDNATPATFGSHRQRRLSVTKQSPYSIPTPAPDIDPNGLADPLDPDFYEDVWIRVAARNTEIFRKVFRCTPDDRCLTWTQFKEVRLSVRAV